jgi:hypothetical protein
MEGRKMRAEETKLCYARHVSDPPLPARYLAPSYSPAAQDPGAIFIRSSFHLTAHEPQTSPSATHNKPHQPTTKHTFKSIRLFPDDMARGNERDKAREKAQAKLAAQVG